MGGGIVVMVMWMTSAYRQGNDNVNVLVCFPFFLQPGSDSGTTAVVALIRGKQLIVANAGDSRCVVSERGTNKGMQRSPFKCV